MTDEQIILALQTLQEAAYGNSKAKGFHDDSHALAQAVAEYFKDAPDSKEYYLKVLALADDAKRLMLMTSELGEALEGLRKDNVSDKLPDFTAEEEELADSIIRHFDHAGRKNLRLAEAILAKMAYNSGRPYMHGKAF